MSSPRVTVLMAVYNGERFLRPAIQSVLDQSFKDFELLIVDDASTDSTPAIIQSYTDPRIRVLRNEQNGGAGYARNTGLQNAHGEYVAVLDADDIAYPDRLSKQVEYLDSHPEIAMVGGEYDVIDQDGCLLQTMVHPTEPIFIRWNLLFGNPIATSVSTFRRVVALVVGGYDERLSLAEDYAFNGKLAQRFHLANLEETIGAYRRNDFGLTRSQPEVLQADTVEVSRRNINYLIGGDISLEVVKCLTGRLDDEKITDQDLYLAYQTIQECLKSIMTNLSKSRQERRHVFQAALTNLCVLRDQCPVRGRKALQIGISIGFVYVPECLFTANFVRFALGTLIPTSKHHALKQSKFFRNFL